MIVMSVVAALAVLALITQAGVWAIARAYPPQGEMIEVTGATLHVVDLGPRDADTPIVMLHGASSNLEAMRRPLAESKAATPKRPPLRRSRSANLGVASLAKAGLASRGTVRSGAARTARRVGCTAMSSPSIEGEEDSWAANMARDGHAGPRAMPPPADRW